LKCQPDREDEKGKFGERKQRRQHKANFRSRQNAQRRTPPAENQIERNGSGDEWGIHQQHWKCGERERQRIVHGSPCFERREFVAGYPGLETRRAQVASVEFDIAEIAEESSAIGARRGGAAFGMEEA